MDIAFLGSAPLMMAIRESGDQGYPVAAQDGEAGQSFTAIAKALMKTIVKGD